MSAIDLPAVEERDPNFNFGYLDERTKRMIRRAILKAVAIPGYQVPFGSREMPLPYGWGTGGIQVTASVIGPDEHPGTPFTHAPSSHSVGSPV